MSRIALLVTGASGMRLPVFLLRNLAAHPDVSEIHLVVSAGASQVLRHEMTHAGRPGAESLVNAAGLDSRNPQIIVHRDNELDASIASGSYRLTGTVILPCSSATLGALATGSGHHLIHRAGAVALKEGWPLLLGFRETPLSLLHLENLRRVAWAGATIAPPVPAFYLGGEDLDKFITAYVVRLLDHLGLATSATDLRWSDNPSAEPSIP